MRVKHYSNSSANWSTIKIPTTLYKDIDKTISGIVFHGVSKYDSVPAFVREACLRLLDIEKKQVVVAEAKI